METSDTVESGAYETVTPASKIAGVCTRTLKVAADRGELRCTRTSTGVRLFDRADLERFARERRRHGAPAV